MSQNTFTLPVFTRLLLWGKAVPNCPKVPKPSQDPSTQQCLALMGAFACKVSSATAC